MQVIWLISQASCREIKQMTNKVEGKKEMENLIKRIHTLSHRSSNILVWQLLCLFDQPHNINFID